MKANVLVRVVFIRQYELEVEELTELPAKAQERAALDFPDADYISLKEWDVFDDNESRAPSRGRGERGKIHPVSDSC